MKKLLGILVLGLLWCNFAYSQDCKNMDSLEELFNCIKENKEEKVMREKSMTIESQLAPTTTDFECLNLCKDSVKGMTISELNSFCMMRCQK